MKIDTNYQAHQARTQIVSSKLATGKAMGNEEIQVFNVWSNEKLKAGELCLRFGDNFGC